MVSLNDKEMIDHEAYETSFGEILGKVTNTATTATNVTPDLTDTTTAKNIANSKKSSRKREAVTPDAETITSSSSSSSSGNEASNITKSKRSKTTSVSFADDIDNNKTAAARAREERSRRRQATHPEPVMANINNRKHRIDHRRSQKKTLTPPSSLADNKHDAKDVVRVPMLTGTLILYRGRNRRAEFVRNV